MKFLKVFIIFILNLSLFSTVVFSSIYNQGGDFSLEIQNLNSQVYNDNIKTNVNFIVKNTNNFRQSFQLVIPQKKGWDIIPNFSNFDLNKNQIKNININFIANKYFDYSSNVISPNEVQIAQKSKYSGSFIFPIILVGKSENISLKFKVDIKKKSILPIKFVTTISTQPISPILPIRFSINGDNIFNDTKVFIRVELKNKIISNFNDIFSKKNHLKFYTLNISNNFKPGIYPLKITIRIPKKNSNSIIEWNKNIDILISKFKNLKIKTTKTSSFLLDVTKINIKNEGNLDLNYSGVFKISSLKYYFFSSTINYNKNGNLINFTIPLKKGEEKTIKFTTNYLSLYLLLIIILFVLIYIYIRKVSNPLETNVEIYDIKRVKYEGVKELKIKIGFENIKEEDISELKIIFRMPSYLNIKENSFSLTEPNHVLKGTKQFKLIWNIKNFEKEDSRILSFSLINPRGILGDIKLPDLEFEAKINLTIRKYKKSFPIIKG